MTTKTAARSLSLTAVPCQLWFNQKEVAAQITLDLLKPERDRFTVARLDEPKDIGVSFTIGKHGVDVFVHEPADLVLDVSPERERNLPRMKIIARHPTHDEVIYHHERDGNLAPPVAVTRSGSDTDLIIGINFDGSSTTALPPPDGAYCELFWRVNSSAHSLHFAAAAAGEEPEVPLILRPKREE
jgi:hypothetical protein